MAADSGSDRRRGWVLPGVVGALLLLGLVLQLRCSSPSLTDAQRAWLTSSLAAALDEGETVLVSPPALAAGVARALRRGVAAGFPLAPPDAIAGAPRSVLLLAFDGAQLPRSEAWSHAENAGERSTELGVRELRLGSGGPAALGYDFWRHLDDARPSVERPGAEPVPCRASPAGRWRCGPRAWAFVGRYFAAFERSVRRCIWAHPPEHGATLRILFPNVPLGDEIRGGLGLIDGSRDGSPVRFRIEIEGERTLRQTIGGKPTGWKGFSVKTAGTRGGRAPVTFVLETDDNRWRQLCFDAVVVHRGGTR